MSDVKMIKKINKNLAAITLSTLGMATHVNAAIEKLANTQLNWQHVNIPSQPSLRGSAIAGNSLWVTGTNNSVWVSQDGGKNWQNRSVKNESWVFDFRLGPKPPHPTRNQEPPRNSMSKSILRDQLKAS